VHFHFFIPKSTTPLVLSGCNAPQPRHQSRSLGARLRVQEIPEAEAGYLDRVGAQHVVGFNQGLMQDLRLIDGIGKTRHFNGWTWLERWNSPKLAQ
jgi:hypothetical protein